MLVIKACRMSPSCKTYFYAIECRLGRVWFAYVARLPVLREVNHALVNVAHEYVKHHRHHRSSRMTDFVARNLVRMPCARTSRERLLYRFLSCYHNQIVYKRIEI